MIKTSNRFLERNHLRASCAPEVVWKVVAHTSYGPIWRQNNKKQFCWDILLQPFETWTEPLHCSGLEMLPCMQCPWSWAMVLGRPALLASLCNQAVKAFVAFKSLCLYLFLVFWNVASADLMQYSSSSKLCLQSKASRASWIRHLRSATPSGLWKGKYIGESGSQNEAMSHE